MKRTVGIILSDENLSEYVRAVLAMTDEFDTADGTGDVTICDDGTISAGQLDEQLAGRSNVLLIAENNTIAFHESSDLTVLRRPFSIDELISAVRNMPVTRPLTHPSPKELSLDRHSLTVKYGGEQAVLSSREFELLSYLMRREGDVVTREEIMKNVWHSRDDGRKTNVADVYVSYLRKKLSPMLGKSFITSSRGEGYVLSVNR